MDTRTPHTYGDTHVPVIPLQHPEGKSVVKIVQDVSPNLICYSRMYLSSARPLSYLHVRVSGPDTQPFSFQMISWSVVSTLGSQSLEWQWDG